VRLPRGRARLRENNERFRSGLRSRYSSIIGKRFDGWVRLVAKAILLEVGFLETRNAKGCHAATPRGASLITMDRDELASAAVSLSHFSDVIDPRWQGRRHLAPRNGAR